MKATIVKDSLFCFLLLFLFSAPTIGQNTKLDSCLQQLATFQGNREHFEFSKLLHQTGIAYLETEDYLKASDYFEQSLFLAQQLEDVFLIVENYSNLSITTFWLANYSESIIFALEPLNGYAEFLTATDSIILLNNLSRSYYYKGQLEKAYRTQISSLKIAQKENNQIETAEAHFSLAEIHKGQKEFEKAIEEIEKALPIYIQFNYSYDEGFCYDLLGEVHHLMGNFEQALAYKFKSCEIGKEQFNEYDIAFCNYTIAETQLALGNLNAALPLIKSASQHWEQKGFTEEYIKTQLVYANWFSLTGDCSRGINLMDTCLKKANQLGIAPISKDVYKHLYQIAKDCGESELAFDAYQQYIILRDSINGMATQKAIANLSATHQLEQQKQELALMQANQKLQKIYYFSLIGLSIFLLLCVGLSIRHLKKQNEYNTILKEKNQEIQKQNLTLATTNLQLKNTNGQLEQANHDLERFAHIVSHDLRSPLRTVGSFTGLLAQKYEDTINEEGKMYVDFIVKGVKHMNQLLADILFFSRAKRAPLEPKEIDLNKLVQNLLQILHATIKDKNAIIIIDNLPTVMGSNSQLSQVFQNLIENALKFIPSNRKPIIKIQGKMVDNQYQISIKDNGIGIPPAHQEKVFSIFRRLHTADEYAGTGLGLAICQTIVQRHQGKIWIESDGKHGTTFHFSLLSASSVSVPSNTLNLLEAKPVNQEEMKTIGKFQKTLSIPSLKKRKIVA